MGPFNRQETVAALARTPSHPDPSEDSKTAKKIRERENYMVATYTRPPLIIDRGNGSKLRDLEGRWYLDFTAGIAVVALGHVFYSTCDALVKQVRCFPYRLREVPRAAACPHM